MNATTATLVGSLIAAAVAVGGYAVNQRALRVAARARMFADALQSVRDVMELPYLIWRRADTSAATVEELGKLQSKVLSGTRFHVQLLEIECPRVARAFYLVQTRARVQARANRDLAWQRPLIGSDIAVWNDPPFRYDVAPEFALCVAAMRAQNSLFGAAHWWKLGRARKRLERRDSLGVPPSRWFKARKSAVTY